MPPRGRDLTLPQHDSPPESRSRWDSRGPPPLAPPLSVRRTEKKLLCSGDYRSPPGALTTALEVPPVHLPLNPLIAMRPVNHSECFARMRWQDLSTAHSVSVPPDVPVTSESRVQKCPQSRLEVLALPARLKFSQVLACESAQRPACIETLHPRPKVFAPTPQRQWRSADVK